MDRGALVRPPKRLAGPLRYVFAAVVVAITTLVASPVAPTLGLEAVGMLYLVGIMLVALRLYRGPAFFASLLSVGAFDFFFVPPSFTFAVKDPRHLLTFAVMFAIALVISSLTVRVRREEEAARGREKRTRLLYDIARDLRGAGDERAAVEIVSRRIADAIGAQVTLEGPEVVAKESKDGKDGKDGDDARGGEVLRVPLEMASGGRYVVVARAPSFDAADRDLVEALARPIAGELERIRLAQEAEQARLRARTEELRSALLSAVSHDLRTPLSTITGAATRLRDDPGAERAAERASLVGSICDEAARLEHLLANILDMTKLEAGALEVKREWVPIEEVIGAALTRLEDALGSRPVKLEVPDDVPLVAIDPVLFAQVFVNLLENAIKYTPAGSEIAIAVRAVGGVAGDVRDVEIEVGDRGPGVPESDVARIFEKFVRGPRPGAAGFGLGLAICRGIIEAHGGTISVHARAGGGAAFRVRTPAGERPPSIEPEMGTTHALHGGTA